MWATTVLKSLTERNFLVPFFSFSLGMASANIFKLANDAALLFYRVIVKTLGTADTALLSHVQTGYHADINFNKAFVNITKQIMVLSIPILIVVSGTIAHPRNDEFVCLVITVFNYYQLLLS